MNFNFIGDIFFPPACVACGDSIASSALCAACRQSIDIFDTLFCGTCAARLPEQKKICHKDAPYLLGAAGRYDDEPLRALIHALKFQGIEVAAEPLAEILVRYIARLNLDLNDFIVTPVPLSAQRARARGFNQSALIAAPFARALGLPLKEHLLARVAHRKPQSETEDIFERRENIRDCFALTDCGSSNNGNTTQVLDKKIILIDDVTTSGTTFNEAARVLKSGGVKKIIALAAAKA
jgi:ComF family protein